MKKNYLFNTKRLGFRIWRDEDLDLYARMNSSPTVMKFFPPAFRPDYEGSRLSIQSFMNHFDAHGFTYFATDYLEDDEFIGFIGLKTISYDAFFTPAVDIGWRLREEYWGRGLATEGAKKCMDYFFDHFDYSKLVSLTPIQNKASWRVMEKIGMQYKGTFDHPMLDRNDDLLKHVLYEFHRP